jgi:hypothetical protein
MSRTFLYIIGAIFCYRDRPQTARAVLRIGVCALLPFTALIVIEIRPHRWGWKAFEAAVVEPVFG